MALLIDIRDPLWMREEDLRDFLQARLGDVTIYCGAPEQVRPDVAVLVANRLFPGVAARLPGLKLVQKLGAGVDSIVADPDLPQAVRIARLKPDEPAQEIAEYCLAYVLREQRNMLQHAADAAKRHWNQIPPRRSPATTVGILGLGHIGQRTAQAFVALGFRVQGWSRSAKSMDGVTCRWGDEALPAMLAECDYVCAVLPSTARTRNLFDARLLAKMKKGAMLINVGRGDLIVDADLLSAIDAGHLAGAVLDVFHDEPLPADHPFWTHPQVTVTPHVSGWHLDSGLDDVAENYRRLMQGQSLLHQVDRQAGY